VTKASASFEEVNGNSTSWNASFADGSVASGFVARETVMLGGATVQGHVFGRFGYAVGWILLKGSGMINATSLTLSDQKISGILGLGFPRLSVLAHTLLVDSDSTTSSSSAIAASTSVSATPAAASTSATASSAYLPPLLESLFGSSQTSYPLIGIVLVPPPTNVSASPTTSTPSSPSSTPRYSSTIGSLTLGGISSLYVSTNSSSGRTVSDIEWWDVIPFGRPVFGQGPANNSGPTGSPPSGAQSNVSGTASVFSTDATAGTRPQESANVSSSDLPSTSEDLSGEEYLYWALDLKNVSMNGTDIGLTSTYASLGIGSIALLDAGSNGIYGPQQDVEKLFSLIPDARQVTTGQWAVPCSRSMTIGFSFGGRYVQLQPSDWMYASVASTSFCLAWPAVAASTGDGIDWQLGTPFLKKVYSIFSYGINGIQAPLVGFLPIHDDTTTSALPTSMADAANATATTTNMTITSQSAYGPTPTQIESLSLTSTAEVDLPNAVLANPTFATPPYAYEISSTLTPGVLQYKGLANASVYTVSQVAIVTAASSSSASTASNSVTSGKASAGSVASNQPSSSGASLGFSLDLTALVVPFGLLGLLLVV